MVSTFRPSSTAAHGQYLPGFIKYDVQAIMAEILRHRGARFDPTYPVVADRCLDCGIDLTCSS